MRGLAGLALAAALLVSVALLAARAPAQPGIIATAVSDDPSFVIANSRDGSAIFTLANLAPGHSAGGSVTVANAGTLPGSFAVSQLDLTDDPGPEGGLISARLQLTVSDVTTVTPVALYSGSLAAFQSQALGYFGPGQERTYRFSVTLPDGASVDDNPLAGSAAAVRYRWTGTSLPAGTPPPADPAPVLPPGSTDPGATEPDVLAADASAPADGGATSSASPLRLDLRVPRRQPLLARGALIAYARCDEPCRLSVWSWVDDPLGPARFLRGHRRVALPPGRRMRLRLRLPWAPRNLLEATLAASEASEASTVHVRADAAAADGRRVTATRDFESARGQAGALP